MDKETAHELMRTFVNEFQRRGNPPEHTYLKSSYQSYQSYLSSLREETKNYVHGAGMMMIALGRARASEFNDYSNQIDQIYKKYLDEFNALSDRCNHEKK